MYVWVCFSQNWWIFQSVAFLKVPLEFLHWIWAEKKSFQWRWYSYFNGTTYTHGISREIKLVSQLKILCYCEIYLHDCCSSVTVCINTQLRKQKNHHLILFFFNKWNGSISRSLIPTHSSLFFYLIYFWTKVIFKNLFRR